MTIRDDSGLYVRKATGLVRAAGRWSVLIYNIMFVSIGLMIVFAISLIPAFYPGSNIQLSFLLALIIVLPTSMVFAMLSVAMPRSGGDYVYVSRALGPAWGMMSNWNQTVWWILYGGVPSAFFAYYGLTPLLRSLGVLTNHAGLITWGDRLSTPTGAFLTGTALIVILVVIFDARSSLGLVRLRVKKASDELNKIFDGLMKKVKVPGAGSPFAEITDDDIDNLFSE